MAVEQTIVLSRDFDIAINTGTEAVPVWTLVGGLDNDGITLTQKVATEDFAQAGDGGLEKPMVTGRGWSVKLKGARLEDVTAGTRDAGQAAIEAVSHGMVYDAVRDFKISSPATTSDEIRFDASVGAVDPFGGSGKATWQAELLVIGEPAPVA
jgi:hypothetical protein